MEKDIEGYIPMLCGYQIKIDNTLNDLEIEIIEHEKNALNMNSVNLI